MDRHPGQDGACCPDRDKEMCLGLGLLLLKGKGKKKDRNKAIIDFKAFMGMVLYQMSTKYFWLDIPSLASFNILFMKVLKILTHPIGKDTEIFEKWQFAKLGLRFYILHLEQLCCGLCF